MTKYNDNYHVIPATPDYTLLSFFSDDDADPDTFDIRGNLGRSPIIGWRVHDGNALAIAISLHGNSTFCQQTPFGTSAVLAPNGTVFAVDGYRYASLDAWITAVRADWKAARVQTRRASLRVVHDRGGEL